MSLRVDLTGYVVVILALLVITRPADAADPWADGAFAWKSSPPLIAADANAEDPQVSIKDPTFIFAEGRWHLFATVRMKSGRVDTGYMSFDDWSKAAGAPITLLKLHDQYYCAPQIFFFRPHKCWYLIYQLADKNRRPAFGPFFSTTERISDPKSWSRPAPMVENAPEKPKWIDFWVICDAQKAHLFYTSNDGHMWRRETMLADFPKGWSEQKSALQADIFEASHTYKLKGRDQFVTIIEAQGGGRRYHKAYLADRLEGPWRGLADSAGKPFAGAANVTQEKEWTMNISHGELIRAGVDEMMEIDPGNLRMVFQGANDAEYRGNKYGQIPWRLGILELVR